MLEKRFKNLKKSQGGSTPLDSTTLQICTANFCVCRASRGILTLGKKMIEKWGVGGGQKKWFSKLIYTLH